MFKRLKEMAVKICTKMIRCLLILFLSFCFSECRSQQLPLVKAFKKQNFICYQVKSFSELKRKVDAKKNAKAEVYYLERDNQIQGFIFFENEEPNFFVCNKDTFIFFLSQMIDGAISIHDSVLQKVSMMYSVNIKDRSIRYVYLPWLFNSAFIASESIWELKGKEIEEYEAYPVKEIKRINLIDTLLSYDKFEPLRKVQLKEKKFVRAEAVTKNVRPFILSFLWDLTKEL